MKLRIKDDVTPYGGKLVELIQLCDYNNGPKVEVSLGRKKMAIHQIAKDCREYRLYEVEIPGMEMHGIADSVRTAAMYTILRTLEVAELAHKDADVMTAWESLQKSMADLNRAIHTPELAAK